MKIPLYVSQNLTKAEVVEVLRSIANDLDDDKFHRQFNFEFTLTRKGEDSFVLNSSIEMTL